MPSVLSREKDVFLVTVNPMVLASPATTWGQQGEAMPWCRWSCLGAPTLSSQRKEPGGQLGGKAGDLGASSEHVCSRNWSKSHQQAAEAVLPALAVSMPAGLVIPSLVSS